jgi:cellulose synthase/poly-beta-1,6-N-acetylglucosamine synthase-like glycosyltransferase
MSVMTVLALLLFGLALGLAFWSYVVYPVLLRRLATRAALPPRLEPFHGSVEVILSAADEESVIGGRVQNLLAEHAPGRYCVTVGCDGSTDQTAERARRAGDSRVRVVEFPNRRGKASVLNDLVAASDADLIVFTDANTRFESGAVECLANGFADARVGAACGRLILEAFDPESLFWNRETRLKEAEGRLGVCLGANGAIYAARREEIAPLEADTAMDDFLIPLRIARRGRRVVFVGDAIARESGAADIRQEMARRFRIGVGAGQVLRRERWLYAFWRHPLLSLAFASRKAARWLAPLAAALAVVVACLSPTLRLPAALCLVAGSLLALSALGVRSVRGAAGRLYYFGVMNLALCLGVLAGLLGMSRAVWKPAHR